MQAQFPPVDIAYKGKTRSYWREFEFMMHQVQQAIEPQISLDKVISKWTEIRKKLSESTRKRKQQMENFPLS
jgi:hypothetical protein